MKIKKIVVGSLKTNCYFLISGDEMAIVDPGDEPEKILAEIRKTKVKVKYIILTHYHFDHILAAERLKKETRAKILIHEADKNFLKFTADQYLKENDKIKIGNESLKVIHNPGHSKGSISLLGDNKIFVGDFLFKEGYGRTDLEGGSDKEMKESLKKISRILKSGITVYPGHGQVFKFKN
ncbi:MAG: MBL fold metallo-hydrolase [Patescibacteria group bacterium]